MTNVQCVMTTVLLGIFFNSFTLVSCCVFDKQKASAAILLSCNKHNISLPLLPRPWWQVFIGPNRGDDLATVCNAILAVGDVSQGDARRARFAFVPSLLKNGSFNDPDSYIWSTVKD